MVKRCLVFVVFLLSLTIILTGCDSSGTNESITTSTTLEAVDDVDSSDEKIDLSEWKSAYLQVIEEDINHEGYALVFIDNDDIPELYMSGDSEASGDIVYSYKNGKLVFQPLYRLGGGEYIENSGCFVNDNGHMGGYCTEVYFLTDSGFERTFVATRYEKPEHVEGEIYNIIYEYYIGDEMVEIEEYENAVNDAFDFESSIVFYDLRVSCEEIIKQINEF